MVPRPRVIRACAPWCTSGARTTFVAGVVGPCCLHPGPLHRERLRNRVRDGREQVERVGGVHAFGHHPDRPVRLGPIAVDPALDAIPEPPLGRCGCHGYDGDRADAADGAVAEDASGESKEPGVRAEDERGEYAVREGAAENELDVEQPGPHDRDADRDRQRAHHQRAHERGRRGGVVEEEVRRPVQQQRDGERSARRRGTTAAAAGRRRSTGVVVEAPTPPSRRRTPPPRSDRPRPRLRTPPQAATARAAGRARTGSGHRPPRPRRRRCRPGQAGSTSAGEATPHARRAAGRRSGRARGTSASRCRPRAGRRPSPAGLSQARWAVRGRGRCRGRGRRAARRSCAGHCEAAPAPRRRPVRRRRSGR